MPHTLGMPRLTRASRHHAACVSVAVCCEAASYLGERHFRIPQNADRARTMFVKWDKLHYWSIDGYQAAEDPYDGITDEFEWMKKPTAEYWVGREEYIEYAGDPEADGNPEADGD